MNNKQFNELMARSKFESLSDVYKFAVFSYGFLIAHKIRLKNAVPFYAFAEEIKKSYSLENLNNEFVYEALMQQPFSIIE